MTEYLVVCKYPHDRFEDFFLCEADDVEHAIEQAQDAYPQASAMEWCEVKRHPHTHTVQAFFGNRPEDRAGVLYFSERAHAPDDVVRAVQKYINTDFAAEERRYWLRAMQRPTLYGRISKFFRRVAGLEDL